MSEMSSVRHDVLTIVQITLFSENNENLKRYKVPFVSGTDITAGHWRLITGACYEHMWSVGVVTLAGLGYFLRNWIHLQLAISTPTVIILLAYK
jgi:hypothetical protein